MAPEESLDDRFKNARASTVDAVMRDILAWYGPQIKGMVRRRYPTLDPGDVLGEALLRLWRWRDRFEPRRGTLRAWFFAMARRTAIDTLRQAGQVGKIAFDFATLADAWKLAPAELSENQKRLIELLAQLAPRDYMILMAWASGGASSREISERLKAELGIVLSPAGVRLRKKRLLAHLRARLRGESSERR